MTMRLSYFVPPVPVLVAEQLGLLAEAAVEVESGRATSSGEQFELLNSGAIDVAVTAMDNVFVWNARGADLRIVAQVEQTTLLSLYANPSRRSLADLEGCRFAVDALTNGFAIVARRLLSDAGVAVTFVEAGGVRERLDALIAGTVDATLLGPPLDELADQAGLVRLASAEDSFPGLPGQGVVVRASRSAEQTGELRAFLAALAAAVVATESMTDADGVALLQSRGFPGRSAADAWRTRPRSIVVDADGLELVETLRADAGLLTSARGGAAGLVDPTMIATE